MSQYIDLLLLAVIKFHFILFTSSLFFLIVRVNEIFNSLIQFYR